MNDRFMHSDGVTTTKEQGIGIDGRSRLITARKIAVSPTGTNNNRKGSGA